MRIEGFDRGLRLAMPLQLSSSKVEYFVPARLTGIVVADPPLPPPRPADSPRHLLGPWLLVSARVAEAGWSRENQTLAQAMGAAIELLQRRPLTAAGLREAHALANGREKSSSWRDAIAWVEGPSPEQAAWVPPPASAIEELVADALAFVSRPDLPPWILQAFAYYQLIQIHPFADGNGRCSRALVASLGGDTEAGRLVALIAAASISVNRSAVSLALGEVREGRAENYLGSWLKLHRCAAELLAQLAEEERELLRSLRADIGSAESAGRILGTLARAPCVGATALGKSLSWSAKNQSRNLARLQHCGWLEPSNDTTTWLALPILAFRRRVLDTLQTASHGLFSANDGGKCVADSPKPSPPFNPAPR